MRSLFVLMTAGSGAWWMAVQALHMGGGLVQHGSSAVNPLAGLLVAPAVLVGALAGAMLGSMLYPRAR